MNKQVRLTVGVCGENRDITCFIPLPRLPNFYENLLTFVQEDETRQNNAFKAERKRQEGLAREYRRGHRDGRQDAYSEVRNKQNEQSGNCGAYHCTHRL